MGPAGLRLAESQCLPELAQALGHSVLAVHPVFQMLQGWWPPPSWLRSQFESFQWSHEEQFRSHISPSQYFVRV